MDCQSAVCPGRHVLEELAAHKQGNAGRGRTQQHNVWRDIFLALPQTHLDPSRYSMYVNWEIQHSFQSLPLQSLP